MATTTGEDLALAQVEASSPTYSGDDHSFSGMGNAKKLAAQQAAAAKAAPRRPWG